MLVCALQQPYRALPQIQPQTLRSDEVQYIPSFLSWFLHFSFTFTEKISAYDSYEY